MEFEAKLIVSLDAGERVLGDGRIPAPDVHMGAVINIAFEDGQQRFRDGKAEAAQNVELCRLHLGLRPSVELQGNASGAEQRRGEQRRRIDGAIHFAGIKNHRRGFCRIFLVVQRPIPEHPKRLDDVRVGAIAGVFQDFVNQIPAVGFVVDDLERDRVASELAGLHSGHHDDVADTVQLLANGCMYSPVLPKLVVEVIHLLKLGAYDFHERLDIGLAPELLDKVVFQGRYIISHQSPPRSSPPWCRPADAP